MPKYLHIALNFQSDFPNLIDLRAIFSQRQGPLALGSERQQNPCCRFADLGLHSLPRLICPKTQKSLGYSAKWFLVFTLVQACTCIYFLQVLTLFEIKM